MTDPLPSSPAGVAQKADAFNWDGSALEQGIALALSGAFDSGASDVIAFIDYS